ncbi:MAG TPA: PINc/VapC family ATPase [Candidatus Methanofastidiosa archaeon]|nr:PINc/VapC family ATPase [Candidatus Methanofastidiosa archaeon]
MIIVPDTSVILDGRFSTFLESNAVDEVIMPEPVIAEIEHQANTGKSSGEAGIRELMKIKNICEQASIPFSHYGKRPDPREIMYAYLGEIDDLVRNVASDNNATLITGDRVQSQIARSKGIDTIYLEPFSETTMRIEDFFDETTMSVHLKAGLPPLYKKGRPGDMKLLKGDSSLDESELEEISYDIVERAKNTRDCFIEMEETGATVVQLVDYRIAITKPPFSDRFEITAVHPVRKMALDDYRLSSSLKERLGVAEGILVAGPPGAGKSTFVQAIAEYYNDMGRIVKTMEKPRDLQVSDEITQYTALAGDMSKTGDILLLVRPDYTIFDEMRKTDDFKVFSDLRLAGVGMIGVVHASRTIDAIQRFIGRIELGIIPQLIDTVIHIGDGEVNEIFKLQFKVKVPSGMAEADLARPVIEVYNQLDNQLVYEIYTFGEQVVVMEVGSSKKRSPANVLAQKSIEEEILRMVPGIDVRVEVTGSNRASVYVDPMDKALIIGKKGKNISRIEQRLGLKLDVKTDEEYQSEVPVGAKVLKKYVNLSMDYRYANKMMTFFLGDEELFTTTLGKKAMLRVEKNSDLGQKIINGVKKKRFLYATPV